MAKMVDTNNALCRSCFFGTSTGSMFLCDRYLVLGKGYHRECPVGKCDKWLQKNPTEKEIDKNKRLNKMAYYSEKAVEKGRKVFNDFKFGRARN